MYQIIEYVPGVRHFINHWIWIMLIFRKMIAMLRFCFCCISLLYRTIFCQFELLLFNNNNIIALCASMNFGKCFMSDKSLKISVVRVYVDYCYLKLMLLHTHTHNNVYQKNFLFVLFSDYILLREVEMTGRGDCWWNIVCKRDLALYCDSFSTL